MQALAGIQELFKLVPGRRREDDERGKDENTNSERKPGPGQGEYGPVS